MSLTLMNFELMSRREKVIASIFCLQAVVQLGSKRYPES